MARTKDPELEQRRRDQVLGAVFELLCERSHHEVTMRQVAEAAGVSKGLVTYYFPTKNALLIAAIRHYHAQQQSVFDAIASSVLPANVLLQQLVYGAFSDRLTVERELRFQLEVWSFAKRRPEVRELVAESYRNFRNACESLFERGREEGVVTAQDGHETYLLIHALIDGLSIQLMLDDSLSVDTVRRRALLVIEALAKGMAEPLEHDGH